jgi:HD-like signal output (HDOD) protein
MAHDIMQLRSNMYANASDLASVVEMDPSLAAQVVRYANSPMYGYQGKIITIQDAIARVLGYDVVMDMALGVTLGKSLNMPATGPLGMNNFWQHAIHAAALTHRLSKRMESDNKPQPGAAYLCGLLHDFGFLVLGHLFKDDFELLSRLITENPETPLVELEHTLLGMTHEEIGAWLSEAWNMPRAVTVAIREHHNIDYDGDYAVLANLVLVTDRLLKSYDTAGGADTDITPAILNRLGLTIDKVLEEYKAFIIERDDLDAIALQIAA